MKSDSSSPEAYGAFAYAYDDALGKRFFHAVRPALIRSLRKYRAKPKTHLDLGCGTGLALEYFRKEGWASTGLDISLPMLEVARGRKGRVVGGDFRQLPFRTTFGLITCLYDSFNHMLEHEALVDAFRGVREVMAPDSLFLFDMNHPEVYDSVWAATKPFVARGDDFLLTMATSFDSRKRTAEALVTGWARVAGGKKVDIHELRRQRCYSEAEIEGALLKGGLGPVETLDFDPYGERHGSRVKLFYICRLAEESGARGR